MNVADYLLENSRLSDKIFLAGAKETILHKDLCQKVRDLSCYIYKKIGTGQEIILLSQNNLFFIISYLSIIKSGNISVLVEAKTAQADLNDIVARCRPAAIFAQKKFAGKFIGRKIFTETFLDNLPVSSQEIDAGNNDNDTALVIFTSGSTGKKKGVMLTHKNIRANTESIIKYQNLTENDRIEVVLPFFYSFGLSLLNTHLRAAASMVINDSIFLGSAIAEIKKYQCTGFAGVPSTYQILISRTDFLKQKFPSVRYFSQAGGKLVDKFIVQIVKAFPEKLFFVMYGATEATARLSYLPPELVIKKLGSIGKGIPGVELKVIKGQIIAKGDNIMKGYYKDPPATKKVLKGGKLYTGDLATVDKEGFIYVQGRADNMIKSAGYKMFPGEIEAVINSAKEVFDCFVFAVPDDVLGQALVAAVLAKDPSEELKKVILSHCKSALPSHKVPKYLVFFGDFPLNSSNKKDAFKIKEIAVSKLGLK